MVYINNFGQLVSDNDLVHYGILGMKWGIRRFQPYPGGYSGDGKFVGKARDEYNALKSDYNQAKKSYKQAKLSKRAAAKSLSANKKSLIIDKANRKALKNELKAEKNPSSAFELSKEKMKELKMDYKMAKTKVDATLEHIKADKLKLKQAKELVADKKAEMKVKKALMKAGKKKLNEAIENEAYTKEMHEKDKFLNDISEEQKKYYNEYVKAKNELEDAMSKPSKNGEDPDKTYERLRKNLDKATKAMEDNYTREQKAKLSNADFDGDKVSKPSKDSGRYPTGNSDSINKRVEEARKKDRYDINFLEAIQNIDDDLTTTKRLSEYRKYLKDPEDYWKNGVTRLEDEIYSKSRTNSNSR